MNQPFLPLSGDWVGPPVLILQLLGRQPVTLDGRKRLAEHERRGLKTPIPRLIVRNHLEAIKHLVLASHHQRAAAHIATYAPEYAANTAAAWKKLTGLHHNKFQPLLRELKSPDKRHIRRRSMQVVRNLRTLLLRANEGETITARHLAEALGKFLDD
jgi:hypothetical protein